MAERGLDVIGLDFAAALLNRARQVATELRAPVHWIRGDMRRLPVRSGCAGAVIVMDAFGFFDTEEEHQATLREAARVLTTDGRLALKVLNGGIVLDTFRDRDREERDGTVVSVHRTLTLDPPRITESIRVDGSRGHAEYERRQRLYRGEELRAALEHAGFAVVALLADPDGTPFEPPVSSTIWIVGQRGISRLGREIEQHDC
jgi:ubiquinone/menaquinone biosynthesis C-methylase UbiE